MCKLEVYSIFAILARGVFKAESNIYDGSFCMGAPSSMFNWVLGAPLLVVIQFVWEFGFNMAVIELLMLWRFDCISVSGILILEGGLGSEL